MRRRTVKIGPLLRQAPEMTVAWFAACASLLLTVAASLPSLPHRVLLVMAGLALAAAVVPAYLRRATPASAVTLTVVAAMVSMAGVFLLSNASLASGLAVSRAGGAGHPGQWLFTSSCWCLAAGLFPAGRLVVREGHRTARLGPRTYRAASLLPVLSALAWVIVGAIPVGSSRGLDTVHTNAAIVAIGSFWIGMVATSWGSRLSRGLRRFSRAASVLVMLIWLPTELKILGVIVRSPVRTLYMQAMVAVLSAVWLGWLAREWHEPEDVPAVDRAAQDVTEGLRPAKQTSD
jgi:hypothetical protein